MIVKSQVNFLPRATVVLILDIGDVENATGDFELIWLDNVPGEAAYCPHAYGGRLLAMWSQDGPVNRSIGNVRLKGADF
jgi:hypothetical protein